MEIIHRYAGYYPFGLQKEPQNTYVELIKQNLAEEEINHYKLKYKFFREMVLNHLIKLIKLSREDNNLRFLYEYESLSLQNYLQQFSLSNKKISTDLYKYLLNTFITNIEEIIKELIHYQIRTDLLLNNLAVQSTNTFPFKLKFFVQPQCECFAIQIFNKGRPQQLKNLIHQNKESLIEFYSNEKKKMIIEFQELMELYFGKFQAQENRPNFIINGAKLVFINNQEGKTHQNKNKNIERKKSTSSDKISFSMKHSHLKERRCSGQNKMIAGIPSLQSNSMQEIKTMPSNKNLRSLSKRISLNQNLNNGFQSIHFEPAEIKKDQTMIMQEQEYLQNLDDQIKNIRKAQKVKPKEIVITQPSSNINKIQEESCLSKLYNSNKVSSNEAKLEKKHKYKMKITTSHNIEIQQEKDPEVLHIHQDNLKAESLDNSGKLRNNQFYLKNNYEKTDNQYSKQQVTDQRLFSTRYSDGDTFFLKNQLFSKSTAASLINNEQHQNLNLNTCNCKTDNYKQQFQSKQPLLESYLAKIQTAKEKAQKLLRQYTHNKSKKCNRFS